MILICGLGNIGNEYDKTRHNAGFMMIDYLVSKHCNEKSYTNKHHAMTAIGEIVSSKIIFAKPTTYMNLSGKSVSAICNFYKIPAEKVIIIHDEIDLEFGSFKTKQGGGNAGHNGLKSIDSSIGKNYHRVRIGISRPENINYEISDWVLSKFSNYELKQLEQISDAIENSVISIVSDISKI